LGGATYWKKRRPGESDEKKNRWGGDSQPGPNDEEEGKNKRPEKRLGFCNQKKTQGKKKIIDDEAHGEELHGPKARLTYKKKRIEETYQQAARITAVHRGRIFPAESTPGRLTFSGKETAKSGDLPDKGLSENCSRHKTKNLYLETRGPVGGLKHLLNKKRS